MDFNLADKIVVLTGAGGGLRSVAAGAFAEERGVIMLFAPQPNPNPRKGTK